MGKETKEKSTEDSPAEITELEKRKIAEDFLFHLDSVIKDAEEDVAENGVIDLNKPSKTYHHYAPSTTWHEGEQYDLGHHSPIDVSKAEVLKTILENIRKYIDYLDPKQRYLANGLIIKAGLYLTVHEPNYEK